MTTGSRLAEARLVDDGRPRARLSPADRVIADKDQIEKIIERIRQRTESMQPLWDRMDKDYGRWRGDPFIPLAGDGIAKEDAYTSNEARTLADKLVAIVGSAPSIIRIESDSETVQNDVDQDTERLAIGLLRLADDNLAEAATTLLQQTLTFFAVVEGGWAAARALLLKMEDGSTRVDVTPIDPRHLVFQMGGNGPIWAAIISLKTRAMIEDEWDFKFERSHNTSADDDADQQKTTEPDGQGLQEAVSRPSQA